MSATINPGPEAVTNRNGHVTVAECKLTTQTRVARFWRDCAPKGVAGPQGWKVWSHHLARRQCPRSVDRLCEAKGTALAWGLNLPQLPGRTFELLELVTQVNRNRLPSNIAVAQVLAQWLTSPNSDVRAVEFSVECLAVANLMPHVASVVDEDLWWALIDRLTDVDDQSAGWAVDADMAPHDALAHQILVGELPMTLAYLFPEIRALYKLRTVAQDALAEGILEFLNGAGLPKAGLLPVWRGLLACWTRARAMGAEWRQGFWGRKADEQYCMAAGKSVCLSATSGHALLCDDSVPAWTPDFLTKVLNTGGRSRDRKAACELFEKKVAKKLANVSKKYVPECSEACEWSGLALLRSGFGRNETVVAIDYSRVEMQIDVWQGSRRVLYGDWKTETTANSQLTAAVGCWEETCWFSDSDVDYVEFSISLAQGARLERQVLLARKDKFLLLVDNVMNAPGDSIRHQLNIPLGPAVRFVPEVETRDGLLVGELPVARVLPLALPEWRIDPRIGDLHGADGRLRLVQERSGRNLSCPIFVDLDPSRLSRPCTWRQLTVAQSLEIQPHDVAVGYRVQCGKKQWLVYRSQAAPANRTVLGYNLAIEGMIGRFLTPSGEVEELLQIEG